MQDIIELLEKLSNADAVPGREDEVRQIFEERFSALELEVSHDHLGGVVCEVPGEGEAPPRVAVECHLDEVGFMVRLITRSGLIKVQPLGGFWSQALPGQRLRFLTGDRKVVGVIGATPPHLLGKDRNRAVEVKDLLVDVGADNRAEVEGIGIRPGCFAVPDSTFTTLVTASRYLGKAFDNRLGCSVCLETVEKAAEALGEGHPLPCTVLGVGSVQEEVGLRGVRTSAHVAEPEVAIVVEGSPADDVAGNGDESQGRLGGGVQIRAFDPTMVAAPRLVDLALELCEEQEIPHQLAVRTSGGTDAGHLHLHRRGVPTLVLAAPVRYAHSHNGVVDHGDIEAMAWLVWSLVQKLDRETVSARLLPWSQR